MTKKALLVILMVLLTTKSSFARSATTTTSLITPEPSSPPLEDFDEDPNLDENIRQARGMDMDYHHDHHPEEKPKAVKEDPWAGYYDFLINEGSFKFFAAFELVTALLLVYSAFASLYYAKFNVITSDYDYYDDFFARDNSQASWTWSGLSSQTFQRIMDAISTSKTKYK